MTGPTAARSSPYGKQFSPTKRLTIVPPSSSTKSSQSTMTCSLSLSLTTRSSAQLWPDTTAIAAGFIPSPFHLLITRKDFDKLMAPEFWETTASGRRVSRQFVLEFLEKRYETTTEVVWEMEDFRCQEIAPNNYLVTYTLFQGERATRRVAIWRRTTDAWQAVYHQGTIIAQS